jgi:dTDP-4-dehydrorhamnose 3,5-epimerase
MEFSPTPLSGLYVINPQVFADERGYFYESFNQEAFDKAGISAEFVQDNQSLSQKGTLRGLHAQTPPFAQGKLVRVIQGEVLDVVVDIRKESPTYGEHFTIHLSGENKTMLWIPPGFLHGFITLTNDTIFSYKVSGALYNKASEIGICWNDSSLAINWQVDPPDILLSEKDKMQPAFATFNSPF